MDKDHPLGKIVKIPGTYPVPKGLGGPILARVMSVVGPGRYSVSLPTGGTVEVEGEQGLPIGAPVRIQQPATTSLEGSSQKPGVPWEALIPLGFGGRGARAELKVYVEKIGENALVGTQPAVYLVLECTTELQKTSQWSIYLRGRSVTIQAYPGDGIDIGEGFFSLVREVEGNLKKKGFSLSGSTVVLKKRFSVPRGFHLNIKG